MQEANGFGATKRRTGTDIESTRAGRAVLARRALVWVSILAYAAFFSVVTVVRHETFQSGTFDLAFMDQALWNTLQGRLLGVSIESGLTVSELGYHFEPILILLAPLYWLWASPNLLLVLQRVALALGALPASWLAYDRLRSNVAAVAFALAYLLFPGLQAANVFDFHAFTLSAPALLFAFYFMERRRFALFALAAALAMATKENVPLTIGMFGLYWIVMKREWRAGLATILGAAAWFLLAAYVVVPAFNGEGQGWLWNRYGGMGGSPLQVIGFLLTHPERLVEPAAGLNNFAYLGQLLFPLAFLSLLHPPTLLLAAPGLATNLLTTYDPMHLLETYHYTSSLVPIVVIAAIYGTGTLANSAGRLHRLATGSDNGRAKGRGGTIAVWLAALAVLTASLVYHYYRGYTPLSPSFAFVWPNAHHAVGQRLAASIPRDASVSAQFNLGPHLSERKTLSMFPDIRDADYVFLDVTSQPNTGGLWEGFHDRIAEALARPDYGVVAAEDGYLLMRKGAPKGELGDEFYSFARVQAPRPAYPLQLRFGDAVELVGFDIQDDRDARVDLTLYWRALRPLDRDYLLALYVTDGQGKEEGATAYPQPVNYWYPTSRWQPGETVRVQTLLLPWDPGNRDFGLGLAVVAGKDPWNVGARLAPSVRSAGWAIAAAGIGTIAEIATFRNDRGLVTPGWRPRPRLDPTGGKPIAVLGDVAALVGADVTPAQARPGDSVRVRLDWQASALFDRGQTVFVQVLAPGPRLVAQQDAPPLNGKLPTTFWLPGDGIADTYTVPLPADLPPGEYDVAVGMYDPTSGTRLGVDQTGRSKADYILLPSQLIVVR
ncbi:MAG: DUF2079 domain-containing protein [Chloroflexota bacterium]